jgi:hypothetical protein
MLVAQSASYHEQSKAKREKEVSREQLRESGPLLPLPVVVPVVEGPLEPLRELPLLQLKRALGVPLAV